MAATLTFFKFDRVIQVDSLNNTQISVSVQDLVDEIRDYEDELDFMDYEKMMEATGKQDLGGGVTVGITLELINDWRLSFEARTALEGMTICTVTGGNLVATNQYSNNPIKATDFVQVTIAQSSSATIIEPPSDTNLLYLVESLRGSHASIGNVFYWDPTSGIDTNDGTTPAKATLTFAAAQTLAAAGNNDIIFALSTASSGITTVTETITITVPTLKLRGPGFPFQFVPGAGPTADTITISADSVEVSGFYIKSATGGTYDGISITAGSDNTLIKDCWISEATGNGINIPGGSITTRTVIDTCAIEDCTGDGINIGDFTTRAKIKQCILSGNDNGAVLAGSNSRDNIFENNLIFNNTTYGINIGTGVTRTGVRIHHTFADNGTGASDNVNDGGTDTFLESAGAVSDQNIVDIVDAVWDEVLTTGHTTTNSAAKILRDTKTRATLASLK
ncbi:hypothetical protein A3C59_04205 [Candidatus Daviesbacteria bacterium RIFCSPHIGHO2_02_FULL_36_13]|uniref:Right handed beta helix domain-containing protein n=1 Tax=Candidatus Daviesbacteria bacterium RIFCSPHIGHO2_02_FULL_36_13 TaxID=1797768 RepID=A0A1F5JUR2_9BACT|nr:MAG: hypothetical protein A3C59_04205 [Candidatus Daviesbacteria bacterium RIFCSPHIGHO2_02_FULL_36_13]